MGGWCQASQVSPPPPPRGGMAPTALNFFCACFPFIKPSMLLAPDEQDGALHKCRLLRSEDSLFGALPRLRTLGNPPSCGQTANTLSPRNTLQLTPPPPNSCPPPNTGEEGWIASGPVVVPPRGPWFVTAVEGPLCCALLDHRANTNQAQSWRMSSESQIQWNTGG